MKLDKKTINKLITIFLLMQPFIDLITSLGIRLFDVDISFGMIIRFIFLLFCILYFTFIFKSKYKKKSLLGIGLIIIYCICYLAVNYYSHGSSILFQEFKMLTKTFYFPILLIIFINMAKEKQLTININTLIVVALLYALVIFIAQLTQTQFVSYGDGKMGHVGWFYAPNEIGAILAIISPLVVYDFIKNRKRIMYYFIYVAYVVSLFSIGTKVPFLGMLITIFSFIVVYLVKSIFENQSYYKILLIPLCISIILMTLAIPNTPIGYNFNLHLKWLNIDKVEELYQSDHKTDLINLVFSSRDLYLKRAQGEFNKIPVSQKLIGMGYYDETGTIGKLTEMDYYDLFYRNGIIGSILYLIIIFSMLCYIFDKRIIAKKIKKIIMDEEIMGYFIGLILAFSIALLAGHVLMAPAVSLYIVMLFVLVEMRLEHIISKKNE